MTNPNMINPNPQQNMGFNQNQFRNVPLMLVNSIEEAKTFPMGPSSSVLFMNYNMTDFLMRTTDPNGFPLTERSWSMTETTPKPAPVSGDYVTKDEFAALSKKIDELVSALK